MTEYLPFQISVSGQKPLNYATHLAKMDLSFDIFCDVWRISDVDESHCSIHVKLFDDI
jgi:hypothetical protein